MPVVRSRSCARLALAALLATGVAVAPPPAHGEATQVVVRVISKGAKFVGTSMGGVRVVLRDAHTGRILAEGVTQGTTGDTGRIMREPRGPDTVLSTPDAAAFRATLDLEAPVLIEVVATGPLAQLQSANTVSATQWVVPGRHVAGGDAWLLVLPGFVVDVLEPPAHARHRSGEPVRVDANVTMMCGCPIEPGGLWDADRFEVRAILHRDGEVASTIDLPYAGTTSRFGAEWTPPGPGAYEAVVYAYDPENGNTGLDRTTFLVAE